MFLPAGGGPSVFMGGGGRQPTEFAPGAIDRRYATGTQLSTIMVQEQL